MQYKGAYMRITIFFNLIILLLVAPKISMAKDSDGLSSLISKFSGADSISEKKCEVEIALKENNPIWGSRIDAKVKLELFEKSFTLSNHPLFGGFVFGNTIYQYSVENNSEGVPIQIINEYWIEASFNHSDNRLLFSITHLGKKHGGLIITEPHGKIVDCYLYKNIKTK